MKWIRKGLIFAPPTHLNWVDSHALTPFADRLQDDVFRVYFSGRDQKGRGQIGYFDFAPKRPHEILNVGAQPVIELGVAGSFDDNGITSSWIVNQGGKKYHYYAGWSLGVSVPFYFFVGLAVSADNGLSFQKVSRAPILERHSLDPYLMGSPSVLVEKGVWRMWYVSGVRWDTSLSPARHYYHIKYAESQDGIHWARNGLVCINFKSDAEYAIARPCVLKDGNIYRMWYSYRGEKYRIGYAESHDGLHWERLDDQAGLEPSSAGWDSEMIEYTHIFDYDGDRYMLYNGNGYGRTGIGLAVLSKDWPQNPA